MKDGKLALRGWLAVAALLLSTSGPACNDPSGVAIDGVADFETAWAAVDSVYLYFEFKDIDWPGVYAAYRPRAEQAAGAEVSVVTRLST